MANAVQLVEAPRWVVSDTHFGHVAMLDFYPQRRIWSAASLSSKTTLEQHDDALIDAWNTLVHPDDWVLHLGDVALGSRARLAEIRTRLRGRILLIRGNHDRSVTAMLACGFERVLSACMFDWRGLGRITCRHDPCDFTHEDAEGSAMLLHGHWHGQDHRHTLDPSLRQRTHDVSVDARGVPGPQLLCVVIERCVREQK